MSIPSFLLQPCQSDRVLPPQVNDANENAFDMDLQDEDLDIPDFLKTNEGVGSSPESSCNSSVVSLVADVVMDDAHSLSLDSTSDSSQLENGLDAIDDPRTKRRYTYKVRKQRRQASADWGVLQSRRLDHDSIAAVFNGKACCKKLKCCEKVELRAVVRSTRAWFWQRECHSENESVNLIRWQNETILTRLRLNKVRRSDGTFGFKFILGLHEVCGLFWRNARGLSQGRFLKLCALARVDKNVPLHDNTFKDKTTERTRLSLQWLISYAKALGDRMPDAEELHLPNCCSKTSVFTEMRFHFIDIGIQQDDIISYDHFVGAWKAEYPFIKIPALNRFAKCDICIQVKAEVANANTPRALGA